MHRALTWHDIMWAIAVLSFIWPACMLLYGFAAGMSDAPNSGPSKSGFLASLATPPILLAIC